ncbi:MAG: cytochrome c3 family protein [Planctomycetes bacterium]|nr:cytochrome c3 family protein [Planctomycetota bacterium]MBL7042455.1 cytochrome c3 family protein [Pirellulaceae bacterium]
MRMLRKPVAMAMVVTAALGSGVFAAQELSLEDNHCVTCHGNSDLWEDDTLYLYVTAEDLAGDIHWQKGVLCNDCHGGNAETFDLREAHAIEDGFRKIESPDQIPDFCGHCHSDKEYMQKFDPGSKLNHTAEFWEGVHGKHLKANADDPKAATCMSCHPKHSMRTADDPQSAVHSSRLVATCGNCHTAERTALRKGVHHAAGERNELGAGTPLDCLKCHGTNVHGMLPVDDSRSPTFLDHQVETCGGCHEKYLATYDDSVHGHGLRESGLLVTAVCVDCHGAHDIYYAADKRSTLHATNVAQTCGACHRYIEERLEKSVHGWDNGPGDPTTEAAPGGRAKRKPSCVDCHQGHDQPNPDSTSFRLQLPNRCGNCHADLSLRYGMSVHGELTQLGYEPAAKCSDCHGDHDILAIDDPNAQTAAGNRIETCKKCHVNAVRNFATFDPHASHKDKRRYALLYHVYASTETVVNVLFGFFMLHALLWFARSMIHTLRYGRHGRLVTQQYAIIRFGPIDRISYVIVMLSFLGLIFTGLPLKYSSQAWSHNLANALGGFDATSVWHHFFAVLLLTACVVRLVQGIGWVIKLRQQGKQWKEVVFGPDSLVPNIRDAKDAVGMIRWFFGLGPKSTFERWTYWEKFDFWAMFLAVGMIGISGLMLWLPNLFCLILPGQTLNVAKVVHSETALFVGGLIFVIHVFNFHLRPEKFPMDLSILTGMVSEQHLQSARPEYLERMQQEGRLEQIRTTAPSTRRLWAVSLGGLTILALGLALLAWILLASLGK